VGEGGIGIVRISGPEALLVADRVLRLASGIKISAVPPRRVCNGWVVDPEGIEIDEAVVFSFRAPHSYTREDLVEIQAHGGPVVLRRVLEAVLSAGASLAEPGEFTERAAINGRLNLVQAEAAIDLIRAKTGEAAQAALRRLSGAGGRELRTAEESCLSLLAGVEAWLDFPEDAPEPGRAVLTSRGQEILALLDSMLAGAGRGRLLTEGVVVALAGRSNVGKSSLLNALLGEERAIVTPQPGTTRDAVAEEVSLGGIPVRLVDTAGLGHAGDELEALGMARSRLEIARANLALLVLDGSEPLTPHDEVVAREVAVQGRGVVALNKADRRLEALAPPDPVRSWPAVWVSALTGQGLPELIDAIVDALGGRPDEGTPVLSHLRQVQAASEAHLAVSRFLEGAGHGMAWDFLAEDLRSALAALGRLTGRAVGPEVLSEVFSRFCLGK